MSKLQFSIILRNQTDDKMYNIFKPFWNSVVNKWKWAQYKPSKPDDQSSIKFFKRRQRELRDSTYYGVKKPFDVAVQSHRI